jgi:phenylpyruvate tautomerase PptA (4-oxalocrotonate tautomerase family)
MPLLQIQASSSSAASPELLKNLSTELARELDKPERYMMVSFERLPELLFAGTSEPACFAVLKNIGTFTAPQTERLSALLCAHLSRGLGIEQDRIYIEFQDARPHLWGYDGGTFA